MSHSNICIYCNKFINDHLSNLCCHSVDDFIKTANSVYKFDPRMLNDFIYSQPVYLVKDSIVQSSSLILHDDMIPTQFDKIRKLILEFIIKK